MERSEDTLLDLIQAAQTQQGIVDRLIEQADLSRTQLERLVIDLKQTNQQISSEHKQLKLDYQRLSQEAGQQLAKDLGGLFQQQLDPSVARLQQTTQGLQQHRNALQHLTRWLSLKTWGGASVVVILCVLIMGLILKYQLPSPETLDSLWTRQHELTELIAKLEAHHAQLRIRQCGPNKQPCVLVDAESRYTDSQGKSYVLVKK